MIRRLLCLECLKMDNSLLITVSFLFILVIVELFRFTLLIIPRVVLVEKGSIVIKSLGQRCILGSLRVFRESRIIVCMYIQLNVALLILSLCIKWLNIVFVMFIVPRIWGDQSLPAQALHYFIFNLFSQIFQYHVWIVLWRCGIK